MLLDMFQQLQQDGRQAFLCRHTQPVPLKLPILSRQQIARKLQNAQQQLLLLGSLHSSVAQLAACASAWPP
jgi:hypothetical protein